VILLVNGKYINVETAKPNFKGKRSPNNQNGLFEYSLKTKVSLWLTKNLNKMEVKRVNC